MGINFEVMSGWLKLNTQQFEAGAQQAAQKFQDFSGRLNTLGQSISAGMQRASDSVHAMAQNIAKSMAVAERGFANVTRAATGLVAGLGAAGIAVTKLASDANEAASKFQFVFTTASDKTRASLDEFAKAAQRSKYAMREMAADIGALVAGRLNTLGQSISAGMQRASDSVHAMAQNIAKSMAVAERGFVNVSRAATGLVAGLGAAGVAATKLASDANEAASKFGFVFTTAADKTQKSLDEFAKAAQRSKYAMREMAADIGALIGPMGFTAEETGNLSTQFAKLAVDLSSFFNVSEKDALIALRAGIVGESEPLRRLGVQLSEAKIQAEAFALGIATTKAEVTGATKTQAIYSLIMKQTQTAQGDAVRTAGAFANSFRGMQGAIKDFATDAGQVFIPVATKMVQTVRDFMQPMAEWVAVNQELFKQKVGEYVDRAAAAMANLGKSAYATFEYLKPAVLQVWSYATGLYQSFMAWFTTLPEGTQQALKMAAAFVGVGLVLEKIGGSIPFLGQFAGALGALLNPLNALGGAVKFILPLLSGAGGLIGLFTSLAGVIGAGGIIPIAIAALVALIASGGDLSGALSGLLELLKGLARDGWDVAKGAMEAFTGYMQGDGMKAMAGYHSALAGLSEMAAKLAENLGLAEHAAQFKGLAADQRNLAASEARGSTQEAAMTGRMNERYGDDRVSSALRASNAAAQRVRELEMKKRDVATSWWTKNTERGDRQLAQIEKDLVAARAERDRLMTEHRLTQQAEQAQLENAAPLKEREAQARATPTGYDALSADEYDRLMRGPRKGRKVNRGGGGGEIDRKEIADEERIRVEERAKLAQANPQQAQAAATGQPPKQTAAEKATEKLMLEGMTPEERKAYQQSKLAATAGLTPEQAAALAGTTKREVVDMTSAATGGGGELSNREAAQAAREARRDAAQAARMAKKEAYLLRSQTAAFKAAQAMEGTADATDKLADAEKKLTDQEEADLLHKQGKLTPDEQQGQVAMQQMGQAAFAHFSEQFAHVMSQAFGGGQDEVNAMIAQAKQAGNPLTAMNLLIQNVQAKKAMTGYNLTQLSMGGTRGNIGGFAGQSGGLNEAYMATTNDPAYLAFKGFNDLLANLQKQRDALASSLAHAKPIPKMAEGGMVQKPTMALVGEQGPEAVIPLSNLWNMLGTGFGGLISNRIGQTMTQGFAALQNNAGFWSQRVGQWANAGGANPNWGLVDAYNSSINQAADYIHGMQSHSQIDLQPLRGSHVLGGTNPYTGAPGRAVRGGRAPMGVNYSSDYGAPMPVQHNITINVQGADLTTDAGARAVAQRLVPHVDAVLKSAGTDMHGRSVLTGVRQPFNASPVGYAR